MSRWRFKINCHLSCDSSRRYPHWTCKWRRRTRWCAGSKRRSGCSRAASAPPRKSSSFDSRPWRCTSGRPSRAPNQLPTWNSILVNLRSSIPFNRWCRHQRRFVGLISIYCNWFMNCAHFSVIDWFFAEKYHSQMKEAQQVVAEKTGTLEAESYKTKRLHVSRCNWLFFNSSTSK